MDQSIIVENLITAFYKLPGIGHKSARRLAYHIIRLDNEKAMNLSRAIIAAKENLQLCKKCFNLTENEYCNICANKKRDTERILVVENFNDLYLFENLHIYDGLYHVLGGILNPLDGIGLKDIKLDELFLRVKNAGIKEIIIALNQSVEGNSTSIYIADYLSASNIKISKLAQGIPAGGEIEYTDEITLKQAFENRESLL